ncbi:clarin-2 [Protopterus annectens]|uniref:clarin-2 n=1 Tax=Protopterus annectens TaxID=7888 RepID=UPI001CF965C1|nr:clarin-2 [Protopterus annectens]
MPGLLKKTLFSLASIISFTSALLLFVALATQKWMSGKILCITGAELVNASNPELVKFLGDIQYGLFHGSKVRRCGLGMRQSKFSIFPQLVKKLNAALHVMIILFLCVAIVFALVSFGFCIYNAVKVPYRSVRGPKGIHLWNIVAGLFVVLAVVSFIAAVKKHHLTERIANFSESAFQYLILEEQYRSSFWLCVASAAAHALNLLVVAITSIDFPEFKPKTEEVTVTAEDLMY